MTETRGRGRPPRETQKRENKKRIPAGSPKLKLSAQGIKEGYRGYFAKPEQFEELEAAGYEFVTKDDHVTIGTDKKGDTDLGNLVSRDGGGGERLYLLQIRKDWYDENQAIKQGDIDETEKAIFEPTNDNQYLSERSVKNDTRG